MRKLTMLASREGLDAGTVVDMPDAIADAWIRRGIARRYDPATDSDNARPNKAVKKRQVRRKHGG